MSQPVLVYDRIDANRRDTRLLLAEFALAALPFVLGMAFLLERWVHVFGPTGKGLMFIALGLATVAAIAITWFLISRSGAEILLRIARARPIGFEEAPEFFRVVENLSIGAGLARPNLCIVESAAPNAFATGRDSGRASLVVTRGLLDLLDRRELEGVIAHELSHIGNGDIRLNTSLAALVGTLTFPLRMLAALVELHTTRLQLPLAAGVLCAFLEVGAVLSAGVKPPVDPSQLGVLFAATGVLALPYAILVAPWIAFRIRRAVSRQREFLADADAVLLTRDPEGLALALVKIGAAKGEPLRVGEGSAHLYFVHPLQKGSWLSRKFPSHPPLEERIELLARMGSGIAPAALEAALQAGAKARETRPEPVDAPTAEPDLQPDPVKSFTDVETFVGTYVLPATAVAISGDPAGGPTLTPLYERPDGWSRVLARLPHDAPLTAIASEGHFVRVSTRENLLGYVARSAPLAALRALERTADAGSWKS